VTFKGTVNGFTVSLSIKNTLCVMYDVTYSDRTSYVIMSALFLLHYITLHFLTWPK